MKNLAMKRLIVFLFICSFWCGAIFAQPDLSTPLGPTIADTGSTFYRFEKFELDSNDGERHYKIVVGIPKSTTESAVITVPEKGFPVVYLLDGNAALAALNDEIFSRLGEELPVIVAIGYQTELRFDVTSRVFDYTPALPDTAEQKDDRGRKSGGADQFAEFIETKIKPKAESLVSIDKQRQTVWGHSYGGLFVLNILFKHPEMFQNYIAADPSLGRFDGVILKIERQFAEQIIQKKVAKNKLSLAVLVGRGVRTQRRNTEPSAGQLPVGQSQEHSVNQPAGRPAEIRGSVPANLAEDLVKRFEPQLKKVMFRAFDDLTHGAMLPASLEPAIQWSVREN